MIELDDYCRELALHYGLWLYWHEEGSKENEARSEFHGRLVVRTLYYLSFHCVREHVRKHGFEAQSSYSHRKLWDFLADPSQSGQIPHSAELSQVGLDQKIEREWACYNLRSTKSWNKFMNETMSKTDFILSLTNPPLQKLLADMTARHQKAVATTLTEARRRRRQAKARAESSGSELDQ